MACYSVTDMMIQFWKPSCLGVSLASCEGSKSCAWPFNLKLQLSIKCDDKVAGLYVGISTYTFSETKGERSCAIDRRGRLLKEPMLHSASWPFHHIPTTLAQVLLLWALSSSILHSRLIAIWLSASPTSLSCQLNFMKNAIEKIFSIAFYFVVQRCRRNQEASLKMQWQKQFPL